MFLALMRQGIVSFLLIALFLWIKKRYIVIGSKTMGQHLTVCPGQEYGAVTKVMPVLCLL